MGWTHVLLTGMLLLAVAADSGPTVACLRFLPQLKLASGILSGCWSLESGVWSCSVQLG